jgi:hypothetical protein
MASGDQIEITGTDLKVACFEQVQSDGFAVEKHVSPDLDHLDEIGLSERQLPDGTWQKLVGQPFPLRRGGAS